MLDTEAHSLEQVTDLMLDNMLSCSLITFDSRDKVSENQHSSNTETTDYR